VPDVRPGQTWADNDRRAARRRPHDVPAHQGAAVSTGTINEARIELPIIRWWPWAIWVRIGVSISGNLAPSWKPKSMYAGLVGRLAWPLVFGRGPYVIWLRHRPKPTRTLGQPNATPTGDPT
jgi:hypothetical protein